MVSSLLVLGLLGPAMQEADGSSPSRDLPPELTEEGVSRVLADHREETLSDVEYDVELRIPDAREEPVTGRLVARFRWEDPSGLPVILDFEDAGTRVSGLTVNGAGVAWRPEHDHIVLPASAFEAGRRNRVEIRFRAGEAPLNRHEEYLYTLFVPDRAHHALPVFDQPALKARFRLSLEIPAGWVAVANTPVVGADARGGRRAREGEADTRRRLEFRRTEPISTYLFAFAAGRFQTITETVGGRRLTFYHRETDRERVKRNRDEIFRLHGAAIEWLEEYTAVPYPFEKFDFVAVPDFQYGGMEHPGAVLYRAANLFLEESATRTQELGRASLIAHETAHMWFGNLVTQHWFDDVWKKEVFANFMAARIVHPSFPDVEHDLRFLLAHHPQAYAVDRSAGAHPIRQELENLVEAGGLYGPIVYQKAPVVMRQLEALVGEEVFREGVRRYLDRYRYGNASWSELVAIIDELHPVDLESWSRAWVMEAGRPEVEALLQLADGDADGSGRVASLRLLQHDPVGSARLWPQRVVAVVGRGGELVRLDADLLQPEEEVSAAVGLARPDFVLPDGSGLGYGLFRLDAASRAYLLEQLPSLPDPLVRAASHLAIWDAFLEGEVRPEQMLDLLTASLDEQDDLLLDRVLRELASVWWRFLDPEEREARAPDLEARLLERLEAAGEASRKSQYFRALRSVFITPETTAHLAGVLKGEKRVPHFPLTESDRTDLAFSLALRGVKRWNRILDEEERRIRNPDRKERFRFLRPAVDADAAVREAFFESLAERENRSQEPWVVAALALLNHPLRGEHPLRFIRPALEMMEEVQRTGDIFFPKSWIGAVLGQHSSPEARRLVEEFLAERPDLPPRLRGVVLQEADLLFRASGRARDAGW